MKAEQIVIIEREGPNQREEIKEILPTHSLIKRAECSINK